jgi:hypothetical protein
VPVVVCGGWPVVGRAAGRLVPVVVCGGWPVVGRGAGRLVAVAGRAARVGRWAPGRTRGRSRSGRPCRLRTRCGGLCPLQTRSSRSLETRSAHSRLVAGGRSGGFRSAGSRPPGSCPCCGRPSGRSAPPARVARPDAPGHPAPGGLRASGCLVLRPAPTVREPAGGPPGPTVREPAGGPPGPPTGRRRTCPARRGPGRPAGRRCGLRRYAGRRGHERALIRSRPTRMPRVVARAAVAGVVAAGAVLPGRGRTWLPPVPPRCRLGRREAEAVRLTARSGHGRSFRRARPPVARPAGRCLAQRRPRPASRRPGRPTRRPAGRTRGRAGRCRPGVVRRRPGLRPVSVPTKGASPGERKLADRTNSRRLAGGSAVVAATGNRPARDRDGPGRRRPGWGRGGGESRLRAHGHRPRAAAVRGEPAGAPRQPTDSRPTRETPRPPRCRCPHPRSWFRPV